MRDLNDLCISSPGGRLAKQDEDFSVIRPRLRLFRGDDDDTIITPSMISISFGELRAIVEDASRSNRMWLSDFSQDEVQIPEDLYDVMTAYNQLRPGA